MNQPERIQRERTKDWRMPPNTIYVGCVLKGEQPADLAALQDAKF